MVECGAALNAVWEPSPNFGERLKGLCPTHLILHYTAMDCGSKAVKWLCNPESQVSSHYLVDTDGTIVQMVSEKDRAWHAGVSYWRGETDINSCSIGIEIQNLGYSVEVQPEYPDVQMNAVEALCKDILSRHNILPEYVLGHSDIAFQRKSDPGAAFDWKRLFDIGVGHWVEPEPIKNDNGLKLGDTGSEVAALKQLMQDYGYGLEVNEMFDEATQNAVKAFQYHWRQERVDGIADISTVHTLEKLFRSIVCK